MAGSTARCDDSAMMVMCRSRSSRRSRSAADTTAVRRGSASIEATMAAVA